MKWLRMIALASALLTLSFVTTGCRSLKPPILPDAEPCDQPALMGPTWYDIAILSVEQRAAIEICNIRNGVDVPKHAQARAIDKAPHPEDCRWSGVDVPDGARPNGRIAAMVFAPPHEIEETCGDGTVGCSVPRYQIGIDSWAWDIYHNGELWVMLHERCHALYSQRFHTEHYKAQTGASE